MAIEEGPVQIVKVVKRDNVNTLELNEHALSAILNDEKVKDKPICIISIAGFIT